MPTPRFFPVSRKRYESDEPPITRTEDLRVLTNHKESREQRQ